MVDKRGVVRLLAVVWMGAAACGGIAVIDAGAGGGGSGGASVSSGPGSVSSTANSSSTALSSSSTGMVETFCEAACDSLEACGGGLGNCIDGCLERAAGPCGDLHQVWINCSLGETNTMCGFGPGPICGPILQDYLECTGEVVGDLGCSGGPDTCECSLFISPGIDVSQACNNDNCVCLVGGQPVGFCPDSAFSCDIFTGCCTGLLFTGKI